MAIDRYESTFVVDINGNGDFTSLQPAIDTLPATGGKIFVKAGVYPITSTITIRVSNVQIQGEGMGITAFIGDSAMTGNTPETSARTILAAAGVTAPAREPAGALRRKLVRLPSRALLARHR
jgi:pectin methylesterase-like acyl-CoA thioesterase